MKQFLLLVFVTAAAVPCLVKAGDESGFRSFRERYVVANDDGVMAYPAETKVLVLSEKAGICSVKIGERTFEVEASKLTPGPAAFGTGPSDGQETAYSSNEAEPMAKSKVRPQRSGSASPEHSGTIRPLYRWWRPIVWWPSSQSSYKIRTIPSAYDWHQWSNLGSTEEPADPASSNPPAKVLPSPQVPPVSAKKASAAKVAEVQTETLVRRKK